MINDLSNIKETKRVLDNLQTEIRHLQRIETQLGIHLHKMENT